MSKILVVFCDGTWNRADQSSNGRPCPTNVLRLFEACSPENEKKEPQIAHYVEGIGTQITDRLIGGMFGYGISANIQNAYSFIASNYEQGDKIFLFGFSRGAYTARSIAGFIRNMGILTRNNLHLVTKAYQLYKDASSKWHPESQFSKKFRERCTHQNETITFLGVWDTVGALGTPFGTPLGWLITKLCRAEFHDVKLSSIIESAYHAVAIDERRWPFRPCLWELSKTHREKNAESLRIDGIPLYEEKWFPGVHSNIGGGYANSGLSDCSLKWMAQRASKHGLHLDLDFSRISEPRFNPDVTQSIANSQTTYYRLTTVLLKKLPSLIARFLLLSDDGEYEKIHLNGDYIRSINERGNVAEALSQYPKIDAYQGDLSEYAIAKLCGKASSVYCPFNIPLGEPVAPQSWFEWLRGIAIRPSAPGILD
ncbi:DUF2235 domain-containing protein [Methylocapsa sp. D3K7]|uniref:DUF2235 domain-containing protein n=1 Tax=Methylocapsa sp. D3K7 TaxID=3041435 RepID=UPI00244EF659|nr:DUF2235 domain-containing protein [Methylocapsa sp. D3K7]WGJ13631.1 DUF2235 domain-containing protein [Methylocapsa sp. D3K7]